MGLICYVTTFHKTIAADLHQNHEHFSIICPIVRNKTRNRLKFNPQKEIIDPFSFRRLTTILLKIDVMKNIISMNTIYFALE
jgi:hypothetical protein